MTVDWRREESVDGEFAIVLSLHVQPGAKRTQVAGRHGEGSQMRLKLRLGAPPVYGKANAELLRFLADAFAVPQRNVTLLRGVASRQKVVRIVAPLHRPDREWA
ncbi:MAG: DUF167 family protein [Betaproteobacteria bacterium]